MIVPNNYIVKDGLNDYILNKKKQSKHLHIHTVNLTDEKGNPSWKERMTKADTDRIIANDDYYVSQREDFNNPIEEGKLFKEHQILKRAVHHKEKWDGLIAHWDLSYTSNGDFKAGILIGVQGLRLTVLKVFCQRCGINSAMEKHFAWVNEYKQTGYSILSFYDATAAQQSVYSPIILQCAEDNKCPDIPIPEHQQGDKHNRIEATITNALFRKILFWSDKLEGKDYDNFINQVLSFEKGTTASDDAPDTLERAISLAQKHYGYTSVENAGKPIIKKRKKRKF